MPHRRRSILSSHRTLKVSSLALALSCALAVPAVLAPRPAVAAEALDRSLPQDYAIASGRLADVLAQFAATAAVPLSFDPQLLAGLFSQGLHGRYTAREGFARLLADTGYTLQPVSGGYLIVAARTIDGAAPDGAVQLLPTVLITASLPRLFETPDVNAGALGVRDSLNVPYSIGSYTTDSVEAQRARSALDVLRNDPSVSPVTYGASYDGVAVRGFSANTFNNVRRDGLLANVYADVPLENKERIDVLKGVSGFLYGVGDPSGLVNYVLKRPTRDPLLSVTAELRTQDGYYANVDAGGPLADRRFGYRFNAARERVGEFRHPGDLDRVFVSGALDAKPNRDAMLQLDFDYQQKEQSASASLAARSDGSLVPADSVDPRQLIAQPWARYKSRSWNAGARLDYTLGSDWTLTGQIGYGSTFRNAMFNNVNAIALNGDVLNGNLSYEGEEYRVGSGQLFASGKVGAGGMEHQIVTGYSYSKMDYPEGPYTRIADTVGNIYHPAAVAAPALPVNTGLPTAHSIQHSLFVSDTVGLGEHWSALLGARYIDYLNDKPRDYPDSGVRLRYAASAGIPTVSVLYKPAFHTTVYATYTKGFEQGAYAPGWADNAYQRLDPITSRQFELGLKSSVVAGLMLSAAAFDIDKPLQAVSTVDNVFKTQGRQHHRGIELAANGQLTRQLHGILGMAWVDAEQRDTGDVSVDGKRPANVARFQASAFLDYRLDAVPGLSYNVGYYHMGNRPLNGSNSVMVDAYHRIDVGAAYAMRAWQRPTVLRLTVQNAANKRYWESVVYGTVGMAQERVVRLAVTTQF